MNLNPFSYFNAFIFYDLQKCRQKLYKIFIRYEVSLNILEQPV